MNPYKSWSCTFSLNVGKAVCKSYGTTLIKCCLDFVWSLRWKGGLQSCKHPRIQRLFVEAYTGLKHLETAHVCVCVMFVSWDVPHCQSLQNRDHFKRFMESMLKNVTKLKTLKRDLTSHYTPASIEPSGPHHIVPKWSHLTGQGYLGHPRSIKLLNEHIAKLEHEYDLLQEEVAKGDTSDFGKALEAYPMTNWKSRV